MILFNATDDIRDKFRTLEMVNIDFTALVLAISTVVLAIITFFYMWETRLLRKAGQLPSFSLEPSTYILGGDFLELDLVNNGQTATEIVLECSWQDSIMKFYIVSLNTGGHARLEGLPVMQITKNSKKITVSLSCKDARGKSYDPSPFEIDFAKINTENRHIACFNTNLLNKLDEIKRELTHVKNGLSSYRR